MKNYQILIFSALLLSMPVAIQLNYDISHGGASIGYAFAWIISGLGSIFLGASLMDSKRKEIGSWVFILLIFTIIIAIIL